MRVADVVVAGNTWLAERARAAGAPYVVVVPTCVESTSYGRADHESKDGDVQTAIDTHARLRKDLKKLRVELLHGRMSTTDKASAIEAESE